MNNIIGIDLGTTNSVVSILENDKPIVIINQEGSKTTPSVVNILPNNEIIVGELAKRRSVTEPHNTVFSVKRLMGRRYDELPVEDKKLPYKIIEDSEGMACVTINERLFKPEEISALILRKMRECAEDHLGEEIIDAVITVPAYFNDSQRQATKKAGELVGLNVVRIVNEPTAAALAYGLDKNQNQRIAVFDFGGGTFDITILEIDNEVFEVRSTNGDTHLGGDDLDYCLVEYIKKLIQEQLNIDISNDIQAMQRIRETAEKVKCELSSLNESSINLPFLTADESGPKHFNTVIKREEFEKLAEPVFQRLIPPCQKALTDAGVSTEEIDQVILVGGSTRIPRVRQIVKDLFNKEPFKGINPDEAVALGAAIQGGIITGSIEEVLLIDVTPLSLGVELADGLFSVIISRNSTIPISATRKYTTVKDNQTSVRIHVLQGEQKLVEENRSLGWFKLTGIPPSPKEVPEIEVTFFIDANGILNVSARDIVSGVENTVAIESYRRVLEDPESYIPDKVIDEEKEVKVVQHHKLISDARKYKELFSDLVENIKDKIEARDKPLFNEVIESLRNAIESEDKSDLEDVLKKSEMLSNKYQELIYVRRLEKKSQ